MKNNYYLFPDKGFYTEIKLEIILNNDSIAYENISFRIKDILGPIVKFNNQISESCTIKLSRKELKNTTLSLDFVNHLLDYKFTIEEFTIISLEKGINIEVIGNSINDTTFNILNKYKKGSKFILLVTKFDHNIKGFFGRFNQ